MKFKTLLGNLFIMSKAERNGSFVLLIILLLLLIIRILIPYLGKDDDSYIEEIERKIAFLERQKDSIQNAKNIDNDFRSLTSEKHAFDKAPPIKYFNFDPNTVSQSQLVSLGFTERVASTLIKFRSKGAKFYKPTDLLKVYGVDSTIYLKLEKYISIKQVEPQKAVVPTKVKPKATQLAIEINNADSVEWMKLPGIGPVFARRICNYRNYLGGFVTVDQLKEVYNLPEETYNKIHQYLTIDTINVKRINLNFSDIDQLKKHPYCDYSTARNIINYRSVKGSFNSVHQLLTDSVITVAQYERLSQYFTISN